MEIGKFQLVMNQLEQNSNTNENKLKNHFTNFDLKKEIKRIKHYFFDYTHGTKQSRSLNNLVKEIEHRLATVYSTYDFLLDSEKEDLHDAEYTLSVGINNLYNKNISDTTYSKDLKELMVLLLNFHNKVFFQLNLDKKGLSSVKVVNLVFKEHDIVKVVPSKFYVAEKWVNSYLLLRETINNYHNEVYSLFVEESKSNKKDKSKNNDVVYSDSLLSEMLYEFVFVIPPLVSEEFDDEDFSVQEEKLLKSLSHINDIIYQQSRREEIVSLENEFDTISGLSRERDFIKNKISRPIF